MNAAAGGSRKQSEDGPRLDSMRSTGSTGERSRRGVLGAVKKGVGAVWDKVTADHPEPLPVSTVRSPLVSQTYLTHVEDK